MTLGTGQIAASEVNAELGRTVTLSLSLNDSTVRALADRPTGQISFGDLQGKDYYTQAEVAALFSTNRAAMTRFCGTTSTADQVNINSPYARYVASSTYTGSLTNTALTVKSHTFMVVIGISAYSPSFSSVTITGTGITVNSYSEVNVNNEQRTRIYYCTGDWRQVTGVTTVWNHGSGNAGSWSGFAIVPGTWSYTLVPDAGGTALTYVRSLGAYSWTFDTFTASNNGGITWSDTNTGLTKRFTDQWWYNNGGVGVKINPNSTAYNGSWVTGLNDGYGGDGVNAHLNLVHFTTMTAL